MDALSVLIVTVIILVVAWVRSLQRKEMPEGLPPGSMGFPLIGDSIEFVKKKVEYFKEKHRLYGRVFKTNLFGKSIIRLYGSDNIQKIIQGENKIVRSSYPTSVLKLVGSQSITMSHGEAHKSKKRELMKYLSPEFFHNHTPVLASAISGRIERWCDQPEIDLYEECQKLFVELAAKFLINIDIDEADVSELQRHLRTFTDNMFSLPLDIPGFGLNKGMKAKFAMRKIIAAALEKSANNNDVEREYCSVLQGLKKSNSSHFEDEVVLLDSIIDLLFSGSQTVNSAGFSLAHTLCKRPDVRERLMKDIKSQGLENPDETICANDLPEMTYVDAVVKETLRVLPPVGGGYRTALETFELDGYTVPKGWSVVFSIRETHMNDDKVQNPRVFNPDQWLQPTFGKDKYSFLPFGGGTRICPGQAYAKMILKLFAIEFTRCCSPCISKDSDLKFWPTPSPESQVLVKISKA
ncbi:cytochrome P450 26A1-like [Ruditapes philippinarum]|uniref:cytochrome P450 26A1-like n=1 Tax=Ruditapes philippinarum TaxID=129788 RepID=UPI00295B2529|nr:cytochrome P450 26A1-like [Ruditapes philippinarum]